MKRFIWVLVAILLFWAALGNFIFLGFRLRETIAQTRQNLIAIVSNAALLIDVSALLQIPLEPSGDTQTSYQIVVGQLEKIKQSNPALKYVYIMTATDQPGVLQYVADADPAPEIITAFSARSLSGDKYDAREFPELLKAYLEPGADKVIKADAWGAFISAYAPIRDAGGQPVAILGVDAQADDMIALQKQVRWSGIFPPAALVVFLIAIFRFFTSKNAGSF